MRETRQVGKITIHIGVVDMLWTVAPPQPYNSAVWVSVSYFD